MKNWLKDIQDKVGSYEVKPSEELMRKLEAKGCIAPDGGGRHHAIPIWAGYAVPCAAVAALAFLFIFHGTGVPVEDRPFSPAFGITAPADSPQLLAGTVIPEPRPLYLRERPAVIESAGIPSSDDDNAAVSPLPVRDVQKGHPSTGKDVPGEDPAGVPVTDPFSFPDTEEGKPGRKAPFSVAFLGSIGAQSAYSPQPFNVQDRYVTLSGANWGGSSVLAKMLCSASTANGNVAEEKYSHRIPLKFGVSVEYRLNGRWSVMSGLNYSFLVSDIYASEESPDKLGVQKLTYLGVPLNARFTAFSAGPFNAYLSAGGAVEYCISGRRENICDVSGSIKNTVERYSEHPFQLSVNVSAGAEYSVLNHISLFAEMGVSNYFKDGSGIRTVYKEKPTCLNTNIGIRFKFGE